MSSDRIGSDEARVWARKLPLRNPAVKHLLGTLANYVDERGCGDPSIPTLAEDTDMSESTVRRKLVWAEEHGVIACFPQWVDASGRLNQDGRGRRAADQIRLILAVDVQALRARIDAEHVKRGSDDDASDGADPVSVPGSAPVNADPASLTGANSDPVSVPGSAPVKLWQGFQYEEKREESSPQSPPAIDPASQADSRSEEDAKAVAIEAWLVEFRETYPVPSNRPEEVRTCSFALTDEERDRAMRGALGVRAKRIESSGPKRRPLAVVDPAKFLRNPALWEEYARFAPSPVEPVPVFFVPFASPEWRARAVRAAICGVPMPKATDTRLGFGTIMRRELEPGVLALAEHADDEGLVDRAGWELFETGSREFGAWAQRIEEWTGEKPRPARVAIEGEVKTYTLPDGSVRELARMKTGIYAPCQWPPAKGTGGHIATGPPFVDGTLCTEEDMNFGKM